LKEKQQSATRQSCIQKWAFLGAIWSKNDQSFCHIHNVMTQEQQYTYLRGRRRLLWCRRCLGGRYHGDEERPALWPNQYQYETHRNPVHETFCELLPWAPLENVSEWSTKAKHYGTQNLWFGATESSFVWLYNKLAIAMMDQRTAVSIT
jgi:hypothetical protein